jgi:hypothetical protein
MEMFIGQKNIFGIEFSPIYELNKRRIAVRYWIAGFAIGNPRDDDFLDTIINGLNQIINSNYFPELKNYNKQSQLKILTDTNKENYKYDTTILQLGESFDNYIIRSFKVKINEIEIVVAYSEDKDEEGFYRNIIAKSISLKYLTTLIKNFEDASMIIFNG